MDQNPITGWTMVWIGLACLGVLGSCYLAQTAWLQAMGAQAYAWGIW